MPLFLVGYQCWHWHPPENNSLAKMPNDSRKHSLGSLQRPVWRVIRHSVRTNGTSSENLERDIGHYWLNVLCSQTTDMTSVG